MIFDAGGNDSFVFEAGFGQDRLVRNASGAADDADRIVFQGIDAASLLLQRDGDQLMVTVAGKPDKLTLVDWFAAPDDTAGHVVSGFAGDTFVVGDAVLQGPVIDTALTLVGTAPVSMAALLAGGAG